MTEDGLTHPVIARLADALTARAAACREILRHASSCQHVLRIAFSLAHGADWASHIPQPLLNDLPRYNCVLFSRPFSPREPRFGVFLFIYQERQNAFADRLYVGLD